MNFHRHWKGDDGIFLATDFDFIAYMSKMAFFWEVFFTPMAFLEYDTGIHPYCWLISILIQSNTDGQAGLFTLSA